MITMVWFGIPTFHRTTDVQNSIYCPEILFFQSRIPDQVRLKKDEESIETDWNHLGRKTDVKVFWLIFNECLVAFN